MHKGRLEAFSDGVIAIIITIMVLEIKVPHESSFEGLLKLAPVFLSYAISFLIVGIYWNNHHHLFQLISKIDGRVLWANSFLLFCLSLVPFASGWMGESKFQGITVTFYGCILLLCAFGYYILTICLLKNHDTDSKIRKAIGSKFKERASLFLTIGGVVISLWHPFIAVAIYSSVSAVWLIPDRRIEKQYLV